MHRSAAASSLAVVLVASLAAACSETVPIPPETRLVASLAAELDPESASAGDSLTATLAGDLRAGDEVLLREGTAIHGVVTAVQESGGRWPAVVKIDFTSLEHAGETHELSARVESVEAETRGDDAAGGDGLIGSVVEGRSGAAMVQPEVQREPGTSVALGTEAERGYLPEGARVEIVVLRRLEVPPAGG